MDANYLSVAMQVFDIPILFVKSCMLVFILDQMFEILAKCKSRNVWACPSFPSRRGRAC